MHQRHMAQGAGYVNLKKVSENFVKIHTVKKGQIHMNFTMHLCEIHPKINSWCFRLSVIYNQGICQSDIVAATLSTHFTSISSLKSHHKSSVPLIGALVLSLQVVYSSYLAVCMLNNSLNRSNRCYCTGRQAIRMSLVGPKVTSPRTTGFNEARGKMTTMLWLISLALWSRWPMLSSQINGAKSLKLLSAMQNRGRSLSQVW